MKDIKEMTSVEMVAEYNKLTGKSIKKFSSRAAGEKQLASARGNAKPAKAAVVKYPVADQTVFHMVDGEAHCPHCGSLEVFSGIGGKNGVEHEDKVFGCYACDWESDLRKPKGAVNVNRSRSISDSWNDPEIAAKRAQRNAVKVKGHGDFRSVREAFSKLGLPLSNHIQFRMSLKAEGSAVFAAGDGNKFAFTIINP